MTPRHVAVIDIGKTNAKVALVDLCSSLELAVRQMPNRVLRDGPYRHYDSEGLWAFILESLASLNAEQAIEGISVTTHGAAVALLRGDGSLALPLLDYEDAGPDETAEAYDALRPDFEVTGSPRLPAGLNLGAQLFWQQQRFPADFNKVAMILTYPQYWSYRLTGVASVEVTSLGCHTDLWNPTEHGYSVLADATGWRSRMAPLRRASDAIGPIMPDLAKATGIKHDCPVACGIHDSNASLLPHLMHEQQPFAVVSTGTWVVAMSVGGAEAELDPRRDTLINVDAFGAPVRSSRFMGGREYERACGSEAVGYDVGDLASVLRGRVMLLPSLEAGTGPFPDRLGGWSAEADGLSAAERAAAAACYLALMTATCLDMIGARGPVVVEGAFARDTLLMSLIAAMTGRPVRGIGTRSTGTSIGAAILLKPKAHVRCQKGERENSLVGLTGEIRTYRSEWLRRVKSGRAA